MARHLEPVHSIFPVTRMQLWWWTQNISSCIDLNELNISSSIVTNSRHYDLLCKTSIEIENVLKGIDNKISGDLLAIDIRQALQHLGELTGEVTNDEVLGNIFSKFCIGK